MELKDIVCDFEYAVRLKKLGVKRKSIFTHWNDDELHSTDAIKSLYSGRVFEDNSINAYTVAELGEMLPKEIKLGNTYYLEIGYCVEDKEWSCGYWNGQHDEARLCTVDNKLANCLAKNLNQLIDNKHVDVEELNNGE